MYRVFILLFFSLSVFAKDIISVNAVKFEKIPFNAINAHHPDSISFNQEFIKNKPASQNAFSIIEGTHSVEYQQNLQDFGGHTGVSINHLPYYYTSTFVDGIFIPENFLDAAQSFGTGTVQSLTVNRGTASTGTNPSSLAGSVEIKTLDVTTNSASVQAITGNFGFYNTGLTATSKVSNNSGLMLSINTNGQNHIDNNKDNIAENPRTRNFYTTLAHQFKNDDLKIKTRLDITHNNRKGGSIITDTNNTEGNPFNFTNAGSPISDGWQLEDGDKIHYNSGTAGLLEIIDNTRFSLLSSVESNNYIGGGTASLLKRDNFYSGNKYKADETNVFLTGARKLNLGNAKFKIGGDFHYQNLHSGISHNHEIEEKHLHNPDGYTYTTTTLFAEINHSHNNTDTNLSARASYHNKFDFIGTLRGKLNYHHTDNIISTIAVGNGYYLPTSSFEQNHALITEEITTLVRDVDKATKVLNATYNTTFVYNKLQANINYNYNEIKNIAALDLHNGDAEFKTLTGKYKTHGIGLDLTYFITTTLLWNASVEKYWHNLSSLEEGYVILSRPEYKLFTKITKKLEDNLFSIKATYFGRQDLEKFYGTVYNLAGIKNTKYSKDFLILDTDFTHRINEKHKIFMGVENMLNFIQVKYNSQIAVRESHGHNAEHDPHLDNINSWGPVRGRFFYIGFQSSL